MADHSWAVNAPKPIPLCQWCGKEDAEGVIVVDRGWKTKDKQGRPTHVGVKRADSCKPCARRLKQDLVPYADADR